MSEHQREIDDLKREIIQIQKLIDQSRVPHLMVKESRYIDHLNRQIDFLERSVTHPSDEGGRDA